MDVPSGLFLDGLQFVQFANAAEAEADAQEAAGKATGSNDMAEAAEHMKEAFSEMQHLAYLLHVTNKSDAPTNTASFKVGEPTFLVLASCTSLSSCADYADQARGSGCEGRR